MAFHISVGEEKVSTHEDVLEACSKAKTYPDCKVWRDDGAVILVRKETSGFMMWLAAKD